MRFKAAVFDLDGTLLDSLHDIASSMNASLRKLGFPEHPIGDYKIHVGDGISILARRVIPAAHHTDELLAKCVAGMREEYARNWASTTRPYEGIPELLDELEERGLKLAVLSNKPDDFTKQIVSALMPRWKFDPVFGARPGIPHKPDPAGAREIARQLNVDCVDCVFIGDTHADIRTAIGAGMYPVGVLWGFREIQELTNAGAKTIISHPREFLKILE